METKYETCSCCRGVIPLENSRAYRHPVTPDGDCPGHLAQVGRETVDLCGAFDPALLTAELRRIVGAR